MNILFVCKHNVFRSKFAEAIFNVHKKSNTNMARSAGVITAAEPSLESSFFVAETANELGYELAKLRTPVTREVLQWADLVVNVADDVNLKEIDTDKLLVWNITDAPDNGDVALRTEIVLEIKAKVLELLREIDQK